MNEHLTTDSAPDVEDRGSVLILTMLLTIVLAAVVLALATYVGVGLRSSRVTTERSATNADASAGIDWAVNALAEKHITPYGTCGSGEVDVNAPAALAPSGADLHVTCTNSEWVDGHPTVHLAATATSADGMVRTIDARVQVPARSYDARILEWSTDAPLTVAAAPDVDTATTTTAATTTTMAATTTTSVPDATTTSTTTAATTTTTAVTTTTTAPTSNGPSCSVVALNVNPYWMDEYTVRVVNATDTKHNWNKWSVRLSYAGTGSEANGHYTSAWSNGQLTLEPTQNWLALEKQSTRDIPNVREPGGTLQGVAPSSIACVVDVK